MNQLKSSVAFSMHIKLNFKIIVVGNRQAGKTSLIMRFVKDIFELNYKVTVGVQFFSKIIQHDNEQIAIQIWDTAGGQNYKSVVRSFYNFAHCVLIVYDNPKDLQTNIQNWIQQIKEYIMQSARLVLVRTKIDLNPVQQAQKQKANQILQKHGIDFFMPVSSRKNQNVSQLFTKIAVNLYQIYQNNEDFRKTVDRKNQSILLTSTQLNSPMKNKKKNGCCQN